ncbi:histidinol-phosphatase [Telmatospirillum siberiense]|uniref:Histidinol-phosphatase n=1 Tax=Telmatospirillum siberiense TaxID=382514 RepID=A0A2N3Q0U9_9PROT|nr:histidinol-phosphatase [Telmatospirillum siberiense]PKU26273.1 histidinol-phosphatase [Telmatospirillum siberiense]
MNTPIPPSLCPDDHVALALRLADAARTVTRSYFRQPVTVFDKADASPVTVADREAEAAMRELIERTAPDHGIYGEEYGAVRTDAEWVWVLDPVDGTKAFITGKPSFGTLIALLHKGVPVLGIIDQPILDERWLGVSGRPSTLNGRPIRVRPCPDLSLAALYATAPEMFTGTDATAWEALRSSVKLPRYGADCYAYGLLAAGYVDLVVEASLQPYDYLPLVAIIEGAGGLLTDWRGGRLGLRSDGRVIAAGDKAAHAATMAVLAKAGGGH